MDQSFELLAKQISTEMTNGKINIQSAVLAVRTLSYRHIGEMISNYLNDHSEDFGYGQKIFSALSERLKISTRILYLCVQFYQTYPETSKDYEQISWAHFKILLSINPEQRRVYFQNRIIADQLSVRDFKALIKNEL
jgi:predicted metalloenzyme YecM